MKRKKRMWFLVFAAGIFFGLSHIQPVEAAPLSSFSKVQREALQAKINSIRSRVESKVKAVHTEKVAVKKQEVAKKTSRSKTSGSKKKWLNKRKRK
ncbi:hypothetical protein [Listeria aquatica]|uniref:Uncharacterized protein n=1 Tax=Listeria aquatica FSL S10-1188 TaxID=1265818 RepID=W7BMZ3_9LIST|nr:hypothetical protein [Listeria aquatica]EUJ21363.1 hypothetical protein MAQA_01382 [Listeria aquatica FSL S10-1188]